MKLVIDRKKLLDAVQTVIGATYGRSVLPVLSHILFRSDGEKIRVTANNLEIQVQHSFASDPHEPFEALWPAKRLHDILRSLSDHGFVGFSQKDKDFHITAGRSRFKLACLEPRDFPLSDSGSEGISVEIPQAEFGYQLRVVEHAMASKDVRNYLNGICLQLGAHLTAVATNGHRLAAIEGQTVIGIDEPKELIVPHKSVIELKRHIGSSGTVKLTAIKGNNGMRADFGDTVVDVRLLSGLYPDWHRVVPREFGTEIDVVRSSLIDALNRTTILVKEGDGSIALDISEIGGLVISGESSGEEVREEIEIARFSGDTLTIGFSPRYLIEALEALDVEIVTLLFTSELVSIRQEGLLATLIVMGRRL
jgi:DNA polymerase-3 subunit beta